MSGKARRLFGSETPRLWTPPRRPLTPKTSRGFEAIEFAEDVLGVTLLPWQRWLLIHMLELNPDGTFRFRTVLILVARQNGKSTIAQVVALWRMFVDGAALVIGTAQSLDIAEDVWQASLDLAKSIPELAAEVESECQTNGKKYFRLTGGQRYKVAAATRKAGRSLTADTVLLDELREHTTWDAWGAVTKTTMARPDAQVLCMSNAGDDRSVVLNDLRDKALDALETGRHVDATLGLFEWSAPPDCGIWDRDGWAAGNPSLGHLIAEQTLASAAETDPEPVFRTECLCQRVARMAPAVIPAARWAECLDPMSVIVGPVSVAVDVTLDRQVSLIGVCGRSEEGLPQVEVVDERPGTDGVVARVRALVEQHEVVALAVRNAGPVTSLSSALEELAEECQVPWVKLSGVEMGAACGQFFDLATTGAMRHLVDSRLDDALDAASKHHQSDAWTWERRGVDVDAAPLVVATVAMAAFLAHEGGGDRAPNLW